MNIFDALAKKTTNAINAKTEELNKKMNELQNKLSSSPLEILKREKATTKKQTKTAKKIINKFYADYPETPYISPERKSSWIEQAEIFHKTSLVQKPMMMRYADGLLPGHVYMLHWLRKYTNKKVPLYFEYKYGIDFEKEKTFLYSNGFLDEMDKPTPKGEMAIKQHGNVIENHTPPKPDRSVEGISKVILSQRDQIIKNGFNEFEFIANSGCCEVCAKLNGKHFPISAFKIGVNAPPMHDECRCAIAAYFR